MGGTLRINGQHAMVRQKQPVRALHQCTGCVEWGTEGTAAAVSARAECAAKVAWKQVLRFVVFLLGLVGVRRLWESEVWKVLRLCKGKTTRWKHSCMPLLRVWRTGAKFGWWRQHEEVGGHGWSTS